jgi:hypothetical protein
MLRNTRISIAWLMGAVLVAGVGFAALRNSSEHWVGTMLLVTVGAVLLAAAGALWRDREGRAWWLGFALFGGGYLALAHWTAYTDKLLPTITLIDAVSEQLGVSFYSSRRGPRVPDGWNQLSTTHRILPCLWALGLATLGSFLAGILIGGTATRTPVSQVAARSRTQIAPIRWKRPAPIVLAVFWIAAITAVVARWPAPGLWAGAGFLVTCGLLGTATLGAAFSRGRYRESSLGAALFGFGYLALTFGKWALFIVATHLPTQGMINSLVRPGGPPIQSEFPHFTTDGYSWVSNEVIMRKLDEPIPIHFPEPTELGDVLTYIHKATREINLPGFPMYVDPAGLDNAKQSLQSTVRNLDFDAIPMRDALRLALKQLDLGFVVRNGFVYISDLDSSTILVYEDPVQIVGHSLLALVAALLGAAAVPLVSDRARRPRRTWP